MFEKKLYRILLGLLLLFFAGCSSINPDRTKEGDLVIFNDGKIIAFSLKGDSLESLGTVAKMPDRMFARWDYILQTDDAVYGKTMENRKPGEPYIYKYDKKAQEIDFIDDGDAFTMEIADDFLYRTDIYTDKVVFYKHDADLKEVQKKEFPTGDMLELTNDLIVIEDKIYLLMGSVDKYTSINTNHLWILTKDLDRIEEIDVDYTKEIDGGYARMVHIDGTLYMTELFQGLRSDGEPGPGQKVVTYNLETKELKHFSLNTPYPDDISYDKERNLLIISHYSLYVEDAKWTFYSLEDGSQRTISLSKGYDEDANLTQHNGNYYFLLKDKLVEYNYDTDKRTDFDLKKFGIESADVLVFNE